MLHIHVLIAMLKLNTLFHHFVAVAACSALRTAGGPREEEQKV